MSIYEQLRALDDRDEPRTLRFASTGLRLWPYVRWVAFCAAADQALGLEPAFASAPRRTLRRRAELLARAALRGPLSVRRPFEIAIVASSAGLIERDGRWFDRINDYFALERPAQTLVLDRAGHPAYQTPRVPPHVRCLDTLDLRASLQARLRRPSDADLRAIDHLIAFARERFPVALPAARLDALRAELVYRATSLPLLRELFARFFERVRPRLLLVEDGSYGAFAHLHTWARAAGIVTAEPQHGVISRSHLAYNLGDDVRSNGELAAELPAFLLVYGELWRGEVRTPSHAVVIGSPHFAETRPATPSRGRNVLVISQGIVTDRMVELAAALARRRPDQPIVFRPHPGEIAFRERYASLHQLANVEVDERGDLYQRIAGATVVIGHSSTALVEAAGSGVPVLVLDDAQSRAIMPADVGRWFTSFEQLVSLVESPPADAVDPARYFATDWQARYRAFVERVIG